MTEKLYYKDAYTKKFDATILSCNPCGERYAVTLDRSAFFPEEGGQTADTGKIGNALVLDVRECEGIIYHYTDRAVDVGSCAECSIDFDARFEKMQCHTAEHILSGYFKKLYGLDNVGFHLGETDVTMDINGVLTREDLDRVEYMANQAVFANVPVIAYFPISDELANMEYRSKLDLTDNVRIVKVGEYDICACCAPHVASTGEIGLIKMLDFEKHKGGIRIYMTAGIRALRDYRNKYYNVLRISSLLCEPQNSTADAVLRSLNLQSELNSKVKTLLMEKARMQAESITAEDGNAVYVFPDMGYDELREICNIAHSKIGGMLVALSGSGVEYKYVISSDRINIAAEIKEINAKLCGKGGGRGNMVQGTFCSDISAIREYFEIKMS